MDNHFQFRSLTSSVAMQEELQLIEEFKRKSNAAFERLYTKYASKMKGVAYRYVGDLAKSEDVLHDAFIKAFDKISTLQDPLVFEGWLRRIVVNEALDSLKREKKLKEAFEESGQLNTINESDNSTAYPDVTQRQLMDALDSLPTGYKTIFNLYVIDGFQHKEIAERMGISEGTSKSQLAKAKEFLKKRIMKMAVPNE